MVFQDFNLFPHITLQENVMLGLRLVKKKKIAIARKIAGDLLDRVGIGHRAALYPSQVSGGQQQRAAIARALAMEPRAILFDEPTSALDPETVGEVLEVMRQLAKDGTTMVVATHEMTFARDVASTICMMEAGKVLETSHDPRQFFTCPENERTRAFLSRVLTPSGADRRTPQS
jgi:ABC-type polar amino acid transport system ATPase subunit